MTGTEDRAAALAETLASVRKDAEALIATLGRETALVRESKIGEAAQHQDDKRALVESLARSLAALKGFKRAEIVAAGGGETLHLLRRLDIVAAENQRTVSGALAASERIVEIIRQAALPERRHPSSYAPDRRPIRASRPVAIDAAV